MRRLAILVQSKAILSSAGVHCERYEGARDNKPGNIAEVLPFVVATPRVEALGAPFFEIHKGPPIISGLLGANAPPNTTSVMLVRNTNGSA